MRRSDSRGERRQSQGQIDAIDESTYNSYEVQCISRQDCSDPTHDDIRVSSSDTLCTIQVCSQFPLPAPYSLYGISAYFDQFAQQAPDPAVDLPHLSLILL